MKNRLISSAIIIVPLLALAAEPKSDDNPSILADIAADSNIVFFQSDDVAALLDFAPIKKQDKRNANIGYRVQVFSDNNVRTARNEARLKQRNIKARFPQYESYVTYNSPYWRLRVGDFKTQEEAQAALNAIRRALPAYARELRVVRDRIKVAKETNN